MAFVSPRLPALRSSLSSSPSIGSALTNNYRIYAPVCCRESSLSTEFSNWLEYYDPFNNEWHRASTIPGLFKNHALKGFSMANIADFIYIIGGKLCHKVLDHDSHDSILQRDLEVMSSVLRYDVRNDAWHKCAPMATSRFDFACTVSDNKIYVAGGKSSLTCAWGTTSAEVYDPALDEWKALPDMTTMRYKCVGVTWQGRIHVVSGFAEKSQQQNSKQNGGASWQVLGRSSAEVYDKERDKWDLVVGMWQLDVPPNQIVAVGDKLFNSGDCLNAWKGHIEAYDCQQNMWTVVDGSHILTPSSPNAASSIKRLYLTMAPIGNRLYFLSGYRLPGETSRSMSAVHVYDMSATEDGWRSLEPMEEEGEKELCSQCCVVKLN